MFNPDTGGMMKHCPRCKLKKPKDEFYFNRSREDGLTSYCKPCAKLYSKEHHAKNARAKSVSGVLKPRGMAQKANIKQSKIIKHGLAVFDILNFQHTENVDEYINYGPRGRESDN